MLWGASIKHGWTSHLLTDKRYTSGRKTLGAIILGMGLGMGLGLFTAVAQAQEPTPAAPPAADPSAAPPAPTAAEPAEAAKPEDAKPEPVAPPSVPPRIVFNQTLHDFGTVEQGEKVTHLFRFTNQGGRDLRIESLKTACGCTAAVISDKVIPSGGEGTISATFDTSHFLGEKKKTVSVYSNDPDQAIATLTLQGEISVEVAAEPAQLYIGRLRRGQLVSHTIEVWYDAAKPIEITKVENSHPAVKVKTEPFAAEGKHGKKLTVTLGKDAPLGRLNDQITVTTTSTKRPTIVIPVFGSLDGDLLVLPPQLPFGVVQPGEVKTRTVNIKNRAKTPVKITQIKSTAKGVSAEVTPISAGAEYSVSVKVSGDTPPGRITGAIQVMTDHPEESVLTIPLYGRVADRQAKR